jgi:hypothetical protein
LGLDVTVDNAPSMDILEGKTNLDEPIEDLQLCEDFTFVQFALDMECHLANYIKVLANND